MKVIRLNSKTPGTRHQVNLTKNLLSKKNNILKILTLNKKKKITAALLLLAISQYDIKVEVVKKNLEKLSLITLVLRVLFYP